MKVKRCSRCKVEKPIDAFYKITKGVRPGRLSWACQECSRADCRAWRVRNLESQRERRRLFGKSPEGRIQKRAQSAVYYAVKKGYLVRREACQDCGRNAETEAHHEDYARRLEVIWVCRDCHAKRTIGGAK